MANNDIDKNLQIVAGRYPLLFNDLRKWIQAHPDSASANIGTPQPLWFSEGPLDYVLQEHRPQAILSRLGQLENERQIVHLCHSIGHLLTFLGEDGADKCLLHERYRPWLMLPFDHASHVQEWFRTAPVRSWPWQLKTCELTAGDVLQAARRTGEELDSLMKIAGGSVVQHLQNVQYVNRPTPQQILRQADRPLRILALAPEDSSYQKFCVRDITESLQTYGVDARCHLAGTHPTYGYEILVEIQKFDPDVLFRISRGREDDSFGEMPNGLTIISWDQDYSLVDTSQYVLSAGPRDLLMVMVAEWREDALEHQVPNHRVHHLNLGTNEKLYHPPKQRSDPEYDLLFVGNYYPFEQYKKMIGFNRLNPDVQELMVAGRDRLLEWIVSRGPDEPMVIPDCATLLQEVAAEIVPGKRFEFERSKHLRLVNIFRYRIAHMLVREQYIKRLAQWRLGLFGKGWDQISEVAHLAQSPIENGQPLVDAIHRSAINLHLHTWTVHHPRLYDTAASGGFLLVGNVPEQNPTSSVFTVGEHVDTFGSIANLEQKIHHWLEHPEERVAMADQAARHARSEHAMTKRMGQLIEILKTEGQVNGAAAA